MKAVLFASIVGAVISCRGFDVKLLDASDRPFPPDGRVSLETVRMLSTNGIETIRCTLKGLDSEVRLLKLVATIDVPGATTVWDGKDEVPKGKANFCRPLLRRQFFLMGAAWGKTNGMAIATGAEDMNSFEDLASHTEEDGVALSLLVKVALVRKGSEYTCTFHRVPFSPKYGIRDALARYYLLYPRRFTRDPRILPGTMGVNCCYSSWTRPDPEACRWSNATWEWCHGGGRSWGDILNREVPTGTPCTDYRWDDLRYWDRSGRVHKFKNQDLSLKQFDDIQSSRFANGYYCGVANGFYLMALANLGQKIARRYPDSVATEHPVAPNDYQYATEIFTFPECTWGAEVRRQLAELMTKHDLGAVAFDVARPASVYRGVRLREMKNVGWDEYGPGVVRGVGSAKLFDYIRTLPNKKLPGNCAVTANTKYEHLTDMLYVDTMMIESEPWVQKPPFPLALRFALGEKGLTLWEGYSPNEFDPNFNKWAKDEQHQLLRDLGHFAVHRSFSTGASLPACFLTEYVGLVSHAFIRMNAAGFKPVIGAQAGGEKWELARYGLGENSWIAVCNEENSDRKVTLDVCPDEIACGLVRGRKAAAGYVYAPFFGGPAANVFGDGVQRVKCRIGAMLVGVLECVGSATGRGGLTAEWEGDFDAIRLKIWSRDFRGELRLREAFDSYRRSGPRCVGMEPGKRIVVEYPNTVLKGVRAKIRSLDLDDLASLKVEHAADSDSCDMADRVAAFFKAVTLPSDQALARKHVSPVKTPTNKSFKDRTVSIGGIQISSSDRIEFSYLVRRFLNVLNAERYPDYAPDCRMLPDERNSFTFVRY